MKTVVKKQKASFIAHVVCTVSIGPLLLTIGYLCIYWVLKSLVKDDGDPWDSAQNMILFASFIMTMAYIGMAFAGMVNVLEARSEWKENNPENWPLRIDILSKKIINQNNHFTKMSGLQNRSCDLSKILEEIRDMENERDTLQTQLDKINPKPNSGS